jgi:hypothetical protein
MTSLPNNEKYIIFLRSSYFKKRYFNSIYKKIIKNLENKGIVIFNIEKTIEEIKRKYKYKHTNFNLTFDNNPFPQTNTLYIHLFNNQYFTEHIYNKTKIEVEREMLFLLAGKLGVKTINYDTEVIETSIIKTELNASIKTINASIKYNKTINKTSGSKGMEEYLNRGAPVYLKANNLQEVEKNIEDRMGIMQSNIFNYNFYKHSSKLESFVYKRFEFKMHKIEYNIETEDLSDISFAVKSCFMNYGIELSYDKNISCSENIHYILEFFTDNELKKEFGKMKRDFMDKFYSIRELYELMDDKDKAVHFIVEYVMDFANNYFYKLKSSNEINNFSSFINDFIKYHDHGVFESICHTFQSTSHIKNWINKMFLIDDMIIVNNNIYHLQEQNNEQNNDISKVPIFEKEELDKMKRKEAVRLDKHIIDLNLLQVKLENIANKINHSDIQNDNNNNDINSIKSSTDNQTDNNDIHSIKSSDIEINKLINNCNINSENYGFTSASPILNWEADTIPDNIICDLQITEDRYAHNLATCCNDDFDNIIATSNQIYDDNNDNNINNITQNGYIIPIELEHTNESNV